MAHADPGTITGLVTFPGETPPPFMYANRGDHDCPHGIAQNHLLVRQENRGLANVLVILEGSGVREVRDVPGLLRTQGCTLAPRVQWVPLGTSLRLVNEDGAQHELRAVIERYSAFAVSLGAGQALRRPIVQPGFYKVLCDRHPWERAWIYASGSPYVAVTDGHGRFEIKNVPPGRYRLRAWHEGWEEAGRDAEGRLEFHPMEEIREAKVREGRTTSVRFDNLQPQ